MITPVQLIAAARSLIGVRYKHQGHTAQGVDCLGTLYMTYARAGIDPETYMGGIEWNYSRSPGPDALNQLEKRVIPCKVLKPGILLFFRFPRVKYPQHFGIYTGTSLIHILDSKLRSRVCEHGYADIWPKITHSKWELPGVDYGVPA